MADLYIPHPTHRPSWAADMRRLVGLCFVALIGFIGAACAALALAGVVG